VPSDDDRRDAAGNALPDWLRDSGDAPVDLNLPDDVDDADDLDDDAIPALASRISPPSVSSVWIAAEADNPAPVAVAPASGSHTRWSSRFILALLIALALIVAIGMYVWQAW